MNKYIKLIDDIIVDFLKDLKSLRYQLILMAYIFNFYILKHHPESISWSIGLLTAVYAFYYTSKYHQAIMESGHKNDQVED